MQRIIRGVDDDIMVTKEIVAEYSSFRTMNLATVIRQATSLPYVSLEFAYNVIFKNEIVQPTPKWHTAADDTFATKRILLEFIKHFNDLKAT